MLGGGVNDLRVFEPLLERRRREPGVAENFRETEDGVQRRAQFVAHIGEQTILHA